MKKILVIVAILFGSLLVHETTAQDSACIFCKIANEKIQESRVVYRNENVVAFLSHSPQNTGHILVVPIAHAEGFTDIPTTTVCEMMRVAKLLIEAIKRTDIRSEAFRIMMNSGTAAGQSVMHAHLHIIPRYKDEVLNTSHVISPASELEAVAEKIRKAINPLSE